MMEVKVAGNDKRGGTGLLEEDGDGFACLGRAWACIVGVDEPKLETARGCNVERNAIRVGD
jgi:hypothetical protein